MFIWTFFDHKDLGNHLLQLCPKVVKHPVYVVRRQRVKALRFIFISPWKRSGRIEWNRIHKVGYRSDQCTSNVSDFFFVQTLCSRIHQHRTLNRVQYPADRDVSKVTWFRKILTQASKSSCGQFFTVTNNSRSRFRCLLVCTTLGTFCQP